MAMSVNTEWKLGDVDEIGQDFTAVYRKLSELGILFLCVGLGFAVAFLGDPLREQSSDVPKRDI